MFERFLVPLMQELAIFVDPAAPKEKSYTLVLENLSIKIMDLSPGGLSFSTNLSECPKMKREDLFIYCMRANLLGQGTGGARIGLDQNEKFLTLSLGLPYEMNYSDFKEKLENFVNYAVYWREEIAKNGG